MFCLANAPTTDWAQYLVVSGVALIAVLILGVAMMYAKRMYVKRMSEQYGVEAFTAEDLEKFRDSGQISHKEFDRMRRALLGLDKIDKENNESKSSAPTDDDDD